MPRVSGHFSAASSPRTSPQKATKKATTKKASTKKATTKKATTKKATTPPARAAPPTAAASTVATSTSMDALSARIEALTGVFTALGARDPERWARAHVEHGHDQIGRFVFLKGLWGRVVRDGRFLDRLRRDVGESRDVVERLLLRGAREADLVQLVRAMQVQLLVDLTQILDDPSDNDEGVRWGLWRMDRRGLPLWQLTDLRLDVLEVDPADDV
jgi:hypothetical protein